MTISSPGQPFTVSGTGCTKALFGAGAGGTVQVTTGFAPPVVVNLEAAPTTAAWSTVFTVPTTASGGSIAVGATCNDPAPYPSSSFTVLAAAAAAAASTAVAANPSFTG